MTENRKLLLILVLFFAEISFYLFEQNGSGVSHIEAK
jgi:hypothetical protein